MTTTNPLTVLFENDDLIVIDKPEGLAVIPTREAGAPCVIAILAATGMRPYVVHRLDKDVSGVLLVAKTPDMHRYLNARFESREVNKNYLAVTHGRIRKAQGRIQSRLRQFGSSRMGVDPKSGKASLTLYRVLETFGPYTMVSAHPVTGRRHQLRVHFYDIGHAIVGDGWYGDPEAQRGYPRLLLHARSVALTLPDGAHFRVTAPAPPSFTEAVATLRRAPAGR
ncbi:MAG TPA: RluA family pseudouridine synthase [Candidatus Polarisedimenticolia bacterium]|nr:RluA family pseudouridine synthase [Candidatus Polarisedimenticolia bacterium]